MKEKNYTNGEVTVIWKPDVCIHAANCTKLHTVFDPKARPWIKMDGATTADIVDQVKQCPSGALTYFMKYEGPSDARTAEGQLIKVEVKKGGPLVIHGGINVISADGSEEQKSNINAFCRCGLSQNAPYCDGSHKNSDFDS